MLLSVYWDVNPVMLDLGFLELRYYGSLMALGFIIGYFIVSKMLKIEKKDPKEVDRLLSYVVIGGLLGARLGHCFFYEPSYFFAHPKEILFVWQGGLASHGGAIGILISLYIYSISKTKNPYLWTLDRVVVPTALTASFIRIGNLMNSEIYGHQTDLPWGFIFAWNGETFPKHPTQIYESLAYLFIFIILLLVYKKRKGVIPRGLLLGMFLVLVFGFRFLIEFIKNPQVNFETSMLINMGQWLSLPFIITGAYLWYNALRKSKSENYTY